MCIRDRKYTEALKGEYIGAKPALELDAIDAKSIVTALADLLNRVRSGEVTTEQAQKAVSYTHLDVYKRQFPL